MRALAKAGYSRGDIARHLGTSYQFVRNVLLRDEARLQETAAAHLSSGGDADATRPGPHKVRLGPAGQIALPAAIQDKLSLKQGDTLFVEAADGEVRLLTVSAAVRKAQAIVRKFVPADVSLVDELLEDRRREAEKDR